MIPDQLHLRAVLEVETETLQILFEDVLAKRLKKMEERTEKLWGIIYDLNMILATWAYWSNQNEIVEDLDMLNDRLEEIRLE